MSVAWRPLMIHRICAAAILCTTGILNLPAAPMYDIVDLGSPAGNFADAFAINNSGTVTEYDITSIGGHTMTYDGSFHELGSFGGYNSYGFAINGSGTIAGEVQYSGTEFHGYWYEGALHDIGT